MTDEQVVAYYANSGDDTLKVTAYLAFELIDVMRQFSALPRNGSPDDNHCAPPFDVNTIRSPVWPFFE